MGDRGLRGRWAWSWQFDMDGSMEEQLRRLRAANSGIIFKVLNGTIFQGRWDGPEGITSPERAAEVARWFHERGVPAAVWTVPRGFDSTLYREIELSREIIRQASRYIQAFVLDVEPYEQFWRGTPDGARRLVQYLRGDVPIVVAPDARPWHLNDSMRRFCYEADGIAPQAYWETFATNGAIYARNGYPNNGVTPTFLAETTARVFAPFPAEKYIIGQGDSTPRKWAEFLDACRGRFVGVSFWRTGVTPDNVLNTLRNAAWLSEVDEMADEALREVVIDLKKVVASQEDEIEGLRQVVGDVKQRIESIDQEVESLDARLSEHLRADAPTDAETDEPTD